jgi:heterodisulfide reductase subunit B
MSGSRYAFFPGCAVHSSAKDYLQSLKAISKPYGVEFEELRGWTCCAPTAAHGVSRLLSIAIPADNLARAERAGSRELVVPCAACYARFKTASYEISNDAGIAKKINDIIGYKFKNSVKIVHPLEIFGEVNRELIKVDFSGVSVVCYYGCLLTRPPKVKQFDDCENPQSMDDILEKLGLKILDWSYKTDCCGATLYLTNKDICAKLTKAILFAAKEAGADVISVACPLCQLNLDAYQLEYKEPNIPALYFTQLIGLAYGIPEKKLGLNRHFVGIEGVLEKCRR